jgi:hypothetical protein
MYPLLVLLIFSAWWLNAALRLTSSWGGALWALVLQLLVLLPAMWLLPRALWTTLLVAWLLRSWWAAYRHVLASAHTRTELQAWPLDQVQDPALQPPAESLAALEPDALALEELGFRRVGSFLREYRSFHAVLLVLETADQRERGSVLVIPGTALATRPVVQLSCRLEDGTHLQATNAEQPLDPLPGYAGEAFPGLATPRLLKVFRAWRAWRFPAQAVETRSGPFLEQWARDHARWCEAMVRAGRLREDQPGMLRYTRRGAAGATLAALFPFRQINAWWQGRHAARVMRALGEPPLAPPRIPPLGGDRRELAVAAILLLALLPLPALPWIMPWEGVLGGAEESIPQGFVVPADYPGAVRALERLARSRADTLTIEDREGGFSKVWRKQVQAVRVSSRRSGPLVASAHAAFRARGFLLFRYEQNFGIAGMRDEVALAPDYDRDALLRAAGTNGANYGIETDSIIGWLHHLEQRHPLQLTGLGYDYLEGSFTTPLSPADAAELAREFKQFCPDVITQGVGSEAALRREIEKKRTLYCWWD